MGFAAWIYRARLTFEFVRAVREGPQILVPVYLNPPHVKDTTHSRSSLTTASSSRRPRLVESYPGQLDPLETAKRRKS